MCALFVANALQKGSGQWESSSPSPEYETSSPELGGISWAPSLKEAMPYRRSEFKRTLKKFKSAYVDMPDCNETTSYNIHIEQFDHIFKGHEAPKHPIQIMLFGSLGYLAPKQLTFVASDDSEVYRPEEEWVDKDIGDIHAIGIGYDYPEASSLFLEEFRVSKQGEEMIYEVPCYRWLSNTRDDAGLFRMLWAYPKDEISFDPKDERFRYGRPAAATRKVKNPNVKVKSSFVEHCFKFSFGDKEWHMWRRYDTYRHMNDLLIKRFPDLNLDLYFPEKHLSVFKTSKSMLEERQALLDTWISRLLETTERANNLVVKSLVGIPPKIVLEGGSPLTTM